MSIEHDGLIGSDLQELASAIADMDCMGGKDMYFPLRVRRINLFVELWPDLDLPEDFHCEMRSSTSKDSVSNESDSSSVSVGKKRSFMSTENESDAKIDLE